MMVDSESSIMESTLPDVHARLAGRLRGLRAARGLTLDGLAERAGVSRSMISLVERGESSPTAAVLDRLAAGLGVTLASLFADEARAGASPLVRRDDQPVWRDPETGYVRRNLSPPGFPSPIELVEVELPPGARVAYDVPGAGRAVGVSEQVWVLDGRLDLTVGDVTHQLDAGDCLALRLDRPTAFRNPTPRAARYVVALAADAAPAAHGGPHLRGSTP
jgi:transcriptional regulator with XRE-family HTH domain